MKLPTIKDIASEAGVNKCVVSHVLHNDAYAAKVRPETRRRILDIAGKIGYRRNVLASSTRTGQVNTIAVILNFSNYQTTAPFSRIMTGIMFETSAHRQSVKVFSDEDLDDSFHQIVENRIGKVIMMSVDPDLRKRASDLADQYSLDLVYAYEHGHGNHPAVNVDNAEATSKIVHYLNENGHTRIGLLCVPHWFHYVTDRHAGYLRGMAECGLEPDPRWTSCSDDIEHSIETMLALPVKERPTALVALSDSVAAKVEAFAIQNGLRFPRDISVVGFGDSDLAAQLPFPLTTMRESLAETGQLLVRLLMKEPIGMDPDEFNVYHTHAVLVERRSVYNIKHGGKK
jgi:LacI family transcriptional regulator